MVNPILYSISEVNIGEYIDDHEPKFQFRMRSEISVLVCSYEVLRSEVDNLSSISWNYMVLDEGHAIRNASTKLSQV